MHCLSVLLCLLFLVSLQACDGQGSSALGTGTVEAGQPEAPAIVNHGNPPTGTVTVPSAFVGTWTHEELLRYTAEPYRSYAVAHRLELDSLGTGTLTYPATDSTPKRTCTLLLSGTAPSFAVVSVEGASRRTGTLSLVGEELVLKVAGEAALRFTRLEPLKAAYPQ